MEKEVLNPEKSDKFTKKDKIVATFLITIILLGIITLVITIKKEKEENYFEVKRVVDTYALASSAYQGFPLKLECSDTQKIDITLKKGSLFNKEETLSTLDENQYTLTCEEDEIIYWRPDETVEENEIIEITFKTDNEIYEEQTIRIQKQQEKYKIIE